MWFLVLISLNIVAALLVLGGIFGKTPRRGIFFIFNDFITKPNKYPALSKIGVAIWRISLFISGVALTIILWTNVEDFPSDTYLYIILFAFFNTCIILLSEAAIFCIGIVISGLFILCKGIYKKGLEPWLIEPMVEKLKMLHQKNDANTTKGNHL